MANLVDTSVNGDLRVTGTMFGTQAGNYATCATAAGTAAKAVTISGFTLTTGIHVFVKFTVTNTAAVASLTLNVSGTGAKSMKYRGGNLPAVGTLSASRVYEFIYDGTNWELVGDLDTNTQTVTGVKGNAESSYRTGQVNITPDNIGVAATTTSVTVGDTTASIPQATTTTPKMDGTAAVGSETTWAKGDHVHPTDTSRAPTSHASSATTYGVGTTANYGHVKLDNSTPLTVGTTSTDGVATGKAHVHNALESVARASVTTADLAHINTNTRAHMILSQTNGNTSTTHDPGDGYLLSFMWDNGGCYDTQLYLPNGNSSLSDYGILKFRTRGGANVTREWGDWEYLPAATTGILLTSSDNLNNFKGDGFGNLIGYRWESTSTPSNTPFTDNHGAMMVVYGTSGTTYCIQVVYRATKGIYQRRLENGTWGNWEKVLVSSDIATGSANGTISVAGSDVAVKGLGGAAYLNTGTASGTVATGNHTHTTSIASDSSSGTVVALTHDTQYKLTAGGTSVLFKTPADSNTDTKVTQTVDTSNDAAYPLLAKNTTATATITDTSRFTSGVTLNPKNKSITANTLIGALDNRTKSLLEMESAGGSSTKYMILATMTYTGAKEAATSSHADRAAVFCNASSTFTIQSRHSGCGIVQVMMQANGYYEDPTTSEGGMTGSINVYTPSGSSRNSYPIRMYRKWTANASTFTPSWTITLLVPDYDWNDFKLKNILQNNGLVFKTSAEYVTATDAELVTTYGTWLASGTIVTTDTKVTQTADNSSTGTGFEVLFSATADNTTRTETSRKSNKLTFQPSTGTLAATKFSGPLTGNVTGNCSGSSGSCTGNAATASAAQTGSALETAINGKSPTTHTHTVKINGTEKTIAATGGTAVDLGTYLTAHQTIKQDGITGATVNRFGTCSTAAGTAAKTVSITTGTFSLEAGAMVAVKFTNKNTANSPTLAVGSTAAKNIFVNGAQITTNSGQKGLLAGTVIFIYDGTQYHLIGNYYDSNSTGYATQFSLGALSTNTVTYTNFASMAIANAEGNGEAQVILASGTGIGGTNMGTWHITISNRGSTATTPKATMTIRCLNKQSQDTPPEFGYYYDTTNSLIYFGVKSPGYRGNNTITVLSNSGATLKDFGDVTTAPSGWTAVTITEYSTTTHNHDSVYLKLAGGTMTGKINAWSSQYTDDGTTGAIDMKNSNIVGLNSLYTADASDGASEGIHFFRESGKYDTLWMAGGHMYFVPNRAVGTSTSAADSKKVAILPASITSGHVVVTDGTSGDVKGVAASTLTVGAATDATYATKIGTSSSHAAVGSTHTPVYVNSEGTVSVCTTHVKSGYNQVGEHDANNMKSNGLYYGSSNMPATSLGWTNRDNGNDGAVFVQAYSDQWVGQIAQDYRTGNVFVRGMNNNSWGNWARIPKATAKSVGNGTTPVYMADTGILTALSYTIATSVPSGAVFTDTKQRIVASDSKTYLTGVTTAPTSSNQDLTGVANTNVYATAGQLHATTFDVNSKCTLQFNTTTNALDFVFA